MNIVTEPTAPHLSETETKRLRLVGAKGRELRNLYRKAIERYNEEASFRNLKRMEKARRRYERHMKDNAINRHTEIELGTAGKEIL
ncbi:hypothetical protein [Mechercharimyces sp. CAU 1602]|uniref:hypothetical protein n=1 Tax=Mechercharimyces sp. CAU 1602 TaxID=2973933 RepID=UPI002163EA04|nr:hypothetical protein [Mechercharimyces sp. CAU 1602]MCS1350307.1 hypothetical protein [Mechercharimyces sp. CAU 1602]